MDVLQHSPDPERHQIRTRWGCCPINSGVLLDGGWNWTGQSDVDDDRALLQRRLCAPRKLTCTWGNLGLSSPDGPPRKVQEVTRRQVFFFLRYCGTIMMARRAAPSRRRQKHCVGRLDDRWIEHNLVQIATDCRSHKTRAKDCLFLVSGKRLSIIVITEPNYPSYDGLGAASLTALRDRGGGAVDCAVGV